MSMLSDQCDRLRESADELRQNFTFVGLGGTVSREPMAYRAAGLMDDAADTITGLRDMAQGAQTENERLRELLHDILVDAYVNEHYEPYSFRDELRELGMGEV